LRTSPPKKVGGSEAVRLLRELAPAVDQRAVHDVGAKVRALKKLKLHGKIMIADDERAIVGSINLSPGSFDDRRELAIETSSDHVVRDWWKR
jgi:phosphatidylserine/phosphatidylglycerophosphate/cardiolipin synthase-like enzyme